MLLFILPLPVQRFLYKTWDSWCAMYPLFRNLILLGVITCAGLLCHGPYKRWRENKELQNLRTDLAASLQAGDYPRARQASSALIQRDRADLETLRIYQQSTAALRSNTHADAVTRLLAHPEAGPSDALQCLEAASRFAPLAEVMRLWDSLPTSTRSSPDAVGILAARLLRNQAPSRAWDLMAKLPETEWTLDLRLLAARILLAMEDPAHTTPAQQRLVRAWADFPQSPGEIIEVLEEIPARFLCPATLAPLRPDLAAGVRGLAGRAEMVELRIACAAAATPAERASLLDSALQTHGPVNPDPLALTLIHLGDHDRLLTLLRQSDAGSHPQRLRWQIDALLALGQVELAQRTFRRFGEILPPPYFHAYAALVARAMALGGEKSIYWQSALEEANAADPWGYFDLAEFARQRNAVDLAEEAYHRAVTAPYGPQPDVAGLLPWLRELTIIADEPRMMEVLLQMLKTEPDAPELLARYTTLAAFTGRETADTLLPILEPSLKSHPHQPYLLEAAAALQLIAGNAAESLRLCQAAATLAPPTPRLLALQIVAAVRDNQILPDHPQVAEIPWNSLLPSERNTLRNLVQQY